MGIKKWTRAQKSRQWMEQVVTWREGVGGMVPHITES